MFFLQKPWCHLSIFFSVYLFSFVPVLGCQSIFLVVHLLSFLWVVGPAHLHLACFIFLLLSITPVFFCICIRILYTKIHVSTCKYMQLYITHNADTMQTTDRKLLIYVFWLVRGDVSNCIQITSDQSKHRYVKLTSLHVYPMTSLYPIKSLVLKSNYHPSSFR